MNNNQFFRLQKHLLWISSKMCIYLNKVDRNGYLHVLSLLFKRWLTFVQQVARNKSGLLSPGKLVVDNILFSAVELLLYFYWDFYCEFLLKTNQTAAHQLCLSLSQFSKCQGVAVHHSRCLLFSLLFPVFLLENMTMLREVTDAGKCLARQSVHLRLDRKTSE